MAHARGTAAFRLEPVSPNEDQENVHPVQARACRASGQQLEHDMQLGKSTGHGQCHVRACRDLLAQLSMVGNERHRDPHCQNGACTGSGIDLHDHLYEGTQAHAAGRCLAPLQQ